MVGRTSSGFYESSLRERNADRHRPTTVSPSLDDREHDERGECALDLHLLRGRVKLEVLQQLRDKGLHFDDAGGGTLQQSVSLYDYLKAKGTVATHENFHPMQARTPAAARIVR